MARVSGSSSALQPSNFVGKPFVTAIRFSSQLRALYRVGSSGTWQSRLIYLHDPSSGRSRTSGGRLARRSSRSC